MKKISQKKLILHILPPNPLLLKKGEFPRLRKGVVD
jgi:hypothetical protein